jgi:hypothetical protein
MAEQRPQAIPILMLVRGAVQLLWQQRDDALRLGLLPTVICFAGLVYGLDDLRLVLSGAAAEMPAPRPEGLLSSIVVMTLCSLAAYGLAMVNWLRFVLLGPMSSVGLGINVGKPHLGYLGACVGIAIAAGIVLSIGTMPLRLLPGVIVQPASVVASVVVLALCIRFIPVLVAIAIGQPTTLRDSWNASRGNAVSILIALVLTYLPFMLVATIVDVVLSTIGFTDVAPIATLFIVAVIQVTAWLCHAGVFAIAFRHLVGVRA